MPKLFVNGRFMAGAPTAVNAVARDLAAALARNPGDWSVTLAVPPGLEAAAKDTGLPVRVVGRRSGIAWEQLDLPVLRREGVIAGFFNTVPLHGKGYVTMLHDAQVFTAPDSYGRATRAWRKALSRRAAAPGNYVLTVSEHSKRTLLAMNLGAEETIGVVPNGLGAPGQVAPDDSLRSRLGLESNAYCVALATVLPHKNIGLLLDAFRDPALENLPLVLIGRSDRAAFEAAGYVIPDNVIFAGFVRDAELAGLYKECLAVLVPSKEEGFGLVALEGMAHGAAVLVADRAALPEVVGEVGIILPANDRTPWVQTLQALFGDKQRQVNLARAGRERAATFTWDAAAQTTLKHLDRWFANTENHKAG
ncbi:MAG: glycosyltransferase family 1 protein [Sulfitobacter sp.]